MSSRIRKATLRSQARQRQIRRRFEGVNFCPHCQAVLKYVQDRKGARYECPSCGPVSPPTRPVPKVR